MYCLLQLNILLTLNIISTEKYYTVHWLSASLKSARCFLDLPGSGFRYVHFINDHMEG